MSKAVHNGLLYWLPVGAYAALIFYGSSLSHPEAYLPSVIAELSDKILHAVEYGVLGILCYRGFRHAAGSWAASHAVLLAIVASAVYGFSDEFHQFFVPFRQADVWDLATDAAGATLGALGWHWLWKAQRRTSLPHGFSDSEKRV